MQHSEQPTADAWRDYARTLHDALSGMWDQFAYQADDGTLYTGGLSALEECEHALNTPAPGPLAKEQTTRVTVTFSTDDIIPLDLPEHFTADDLDRAVDQALRERQP